jgi:NADPH oxidase 4
MKLQSNLNTYPPECDTDASSVITPNADFNTTNCSFEPTFENPKKQSWIWPTIALLIFFIDLLYRYYKRGSYKISTVDARLLPGYGMKLKLKVSGATLMIQPGQYILLQCLNISGLEWHPFTVTKCPSSDQVLNLLVSVRGDWTQSLFETVSLRRSEKQVLLDPYHMMKLHFLVDGPFPSPMENLMKCDRVICIAAGVGITSFISFLNNVKDRQLVKPYRIHLIWISKCVEQFSWFSNLFCSILNQFWKDNKPDRFQITLYLTKSCEDSVLDVIFHDKAALKSRVKYGRPAWPELFEYWSFLYGHRTVDVFSCGPKLMNREVKKYCHAFNKQGGQFTFTHEAFN